jgi:Protein of unknown function (DUF4242)
MTEFLVELYVSKADCACVEAGWERLNRAAVQLTAEGTPVRLVRSIFVPEDETCFVLVEATSAETAREVAQRAAVSFERVVEATVDLVNTNGREKT